MVDAPKTTHASLIGVTLGKYSVQALIGRGATATVYLAKDTDLGRPVALKVLLGSLARNPEHVRRFQMEALAVAPLQHPNIVRIYDAGSLDGVPFIAMEYIEGEPLERFLNRSGALPWQHALHIGTQLAEALDCAHRAGIVHRDVKPANILLDHQGRVRLSDFGIANVAARREEESTPGEFVGTPEYMSPEQCAGDSDIAPSSDLFSLGVTIYRMIGGRMPFEAASAVALVQEICESTPPRLNQLNRDVPDDVARLVAHLLEKERHLRPASARVVVEQIQRLHRENGGLSALPEALQSFVREQSQPRRVKNDTPVPGKGKAHGKSASAKSSRKSSRLGPKIEFIEQRRHYTPISSFAQWAALLAILLAAAGAGYWHLFRAIPVAEAAPVLEASAPTETAAGEYFFPLPAPHWNIAALHWSGESDTLVLTIRGQRGTLAQDDIGVIAIDALEQQAYSLSAPMGPVTTASYAVAFPAWSGPGLQHPMPAGTPFADSFLRPVLGAFSGSEHVLLVPQNVKASLPIAAPVYSSPQRLWQAESVGGMPANAAQYAIKPDGHTLAIIKRNPLDGGWILAEHDARWNNLETTGVVLAAGHETVLPGTLQYSPDGRLIAYMRENQGGERVLICIDIEQPSPAPVPVAIGRLDSRAAFSPDGTRIAVTMETNDGPKVVVCRTSDGSIVADLGHGRATSESWKPDGRHLIVTAYDEHTGRPQLVELTTQPPTDRRVLTTFEDGVLVGAAVSRNGRWAAAATTRGEYTVLALIELNTTALRPAAAKHAGAPTT